MGNDVVYAGANEAIIYVGTVAVTFRLIGEEAHWTSMDPPGWKNLTKTALFRKKKDLAKKIMLRYRQLPLSPIE